MPPNKVPPKSFTVRLNVSGVKGGVMLTKPGLFAFAFLSLSLTGSLITHEDHIHFHSLFDATAPSSSSSSSPSSTTTSSPPATSATSTTSAPTHKALKLEICSGAGEWAAAQALQDAGKANWITLELRHGRVYQTFVRMMMESVHNLCVVGGDANVVMVRPTLAKAKRNRIAVVDLGRCGC